MLLKKNKSGGRKYVGFKREEPLPAAALRCVLPTQRGTPPAKNRRTVKKNAPHFLGSSK